MLSTEHWWVFSSPASASYLVQLTKTSLPSMSFFVQKTLRWNFWLVFSLLPFGHVSQQKTISHLPKKLLENPKPSYNLQTGMQDIWCWKLRIPWVFCLYLVPPFTHLWLLLSRVIHLMIFLPILEQTWNTMGSKSISTCARFGPLEPTVDLLSE